MALVGCVTDTLPAEETIVRLEYDFTKFGEGQKFHTCLGIEYLYDDTYFYVLLFCWSLV